MRMKQPYGYEYKRSQQSNKSNKAILGNTKDKKT